MAETRTQLSRELITATAADLVAREGLDALSMRRLAQELDVWPMSLYRHFRDKEDLLDAVAASSAESVDLPAQSGGWRRQLTALAAEARQLLARQPAELRRRTLLSPGVLRLTDAGLRALREAGLSARESATAWAAILAYVLGSIEMEAATGTERQTQAVLLAASEEEYPDLASAGSEVARAMAGDDAFEDGLARLVEGIGSRLS